MATDQNVQMVTKTWQALAKGDIETAIANMSDEVSWVVPGKIANVSGLKRGKQAVREFAGGIGKSFPNGLHTEIRKTHNAGDTVILELTNQGKAFNGKDYENEYCFIFEVENDKIRRIREYVDMHTVVQTLFAK
ncbi:MAG: nuclear transport factor 2 family protein [Candidatus Binataceae bacterium]